MTLHRIIHGVPYTFARNHWGWAVTPQQSRTDRFHRNYQVVCATDGTPKSCSCPDCHHRGNWCKHLCEADKITRELNPELVAQLAETAVRCGL